MSDEKIKYTSISEFARSESTPEFDEGNFFKNGKMETITITGKYIPMNEEVTRKFNIEFPNGNVYKEVPVKLSSFDAFILDEWEKYQRLPWYKKAWLRLWR